MTATLTALSSWLAAHWTLATLTALVVAWKALPAPLRASLERRFPRGVNLVRVLYALAPDLLKALAAGRGVVTGQPKPSDAPPAEPTPVAHPTPPDQSAR